MPSSPSASVVTGKLRVLNPLTGQAPPPVHRCVSLEYFVSLHQTPGVCVTSVILPTPLKNERKDMRGFL